MATFAFCSLSTSGWGLEFSLRLINLDDDDDDFLFKLPKKLSLVLDVLERFLKKGKSSEFNPRNYEQVKSSPSLTVWSHKGSTLYQKLLNRAKTRVLHGTPNFFLKGKRKYFLLATDIISSEQLRKLEKIKPFGHSKAPKKNMTDIAHFPRPGQSDPYILTSLTKSYLWSCDAVRTEREETSASHFLKHLSETFILLKKWLAAKLQQNWYQMKGWEEFFLSWIQLFWSSQNHNIFSGK